MMKAIRILMVLVGMMVGCTSPQPSPGGEGGILPRPAATPSQRGTEQAAQKVIDTVVLDEEYYRRMWLFEAVGAGEVELDK